MPRQPTERGGIGLPLFAGRLSLDTNVRLRWPAAGKIYRQMLNDEPAAGALWTAVKTLLRTDAQIMPGGTTDADKRATDQVESSLHDMRDTLSTVLRQKASALFYGFDIHERTFKRRADGTIGWAAWSLRRQETIERWETDTTGRPQAFTQRPAPDYKLRTMWLRDTAKPSGYGWGTHLLADDSDGSPEGRGALRPMYRYWYMVTQFELLGGIGLERGVGFPVFQRTDGGVPLTDDQEDDLAAQAEAIRQHEQMYIILPPGLTFTFATMPGVDASSYLAFIQRYRVWMLATALAEFVALGTGESSGSRALGTVKADLFLRSLTGFQDRLCETINRQAIPQLCRYNGWVAKGVGVEGDAPGRLTDYPKMSLPAVRDYDLKALGGFAELLDRIGALHVTPEDEEWFRKISDLVDVDIDELRKLHTQDDQQAPKPSPVSIEGAETDDEDEGAAVEEEEEELVDA
jgi:hypothetical protein